MKAKKEAKRKKAGKHVAYVAILTLPLEDGPPGADVRDIDLDALRNRAFGWLQHHLGPLGIGVLAIRPPQSDEAELILTRLKALAEATRSPCHVEMLTEVPLSAPAGDDGTFH